MNLTTVLGICLVTAVLGVVLKQYKPEYAFFIAIVSGIIIFFYLLVQVINPVFEIRNIIAKQGVDTSYFLVAFKTLGICIITGFVSDICKDFGQNALAGKAEFAGRCAIFLLSLPLLKGLLEAAYSFIG
ncbi:MAG: hypothetical protein IKK77_05110 [Clostridia bacterium]|nr:hypothetical protein [Clostridia bacterium]